MHAPPADGASPRPSGLSLEWKIPLLMTVVLALGLAAMLVITYTTVRGRVSALIAVLGEELLVRDTDKGS